MWKYDLSICLPAIRKERWKKIYDSIVSSVGNYSFELIFCGPYEDPGEDLRNFENVRCIKDFGSPTRAQQIACLAASGKYLNWISDDGWFLPGKLKQCLDLLENEETEKRALIYQYVEDNRAGVADYRCGYHEPIRSIYYPNDYLVYLTAIVLTEYFKDLGGFDCVFEACPVAFIDFGVRAQRDGIKTIFLKEDVYQCNQYVGTTGDHAPIHYAQLENDQPLYLRIYSHPSCVERIKIDKDNWKGSSKIWNRRFNLDGTMNE
mgnify:CR=1 FL=1